MQETEKPVIPQKQSTDMVSPADFPHALRSVACYRPTRNFGKKTNCNAVRSVPPTPHSCILSRVNHQKQSQFSWHRWNDQPGPSWPSNPSFGFRTDKNPTEFSWQEAESKWISYWDQQGVGGVPPMTGTLNEKQPHRLRTPQNRKEFPRHDEGTFRGGGPKASPPRPECDQLLDHRQSWDYIRLSPDNPEIWPDFRTSAWKTETPEFVRGEVDFSIWGKKFSKVQISLSMTKVNKRKQNTTLSVTKLNILRVKSRRNHVSTVFDVRNTSLFVTER